MDGAERDVARTLVALLDCSSLPSACIGVYHVHCAPRVTPHTPQVHTVVMGREPGVHMCTCLQLAHKGLPCRHFFAVLMQYPDLHFDVRAAHPRWLAGDAAARPVRQPARRPHQPAPPPAQSEPPPEAAAAAAIRSSTHYTKLNRFTVAVLQGRLVANGGSALATRSKDRLIMACLQLEQPSLFDAGGDGSGADGASAAAAAMAAPVTNGAGGSGADGASAAAAAMVAPATNSDGVSGGDGASAAAPATAAPSPATNGNGDSCANGASAAAAAAAPALAATGDGGSGAAAATAVAAPAPPTTGGDDSTPFELSLALLAIFDINNSSADAACSRAIQVQHIPTPHACALGRMREQHVCYACRSTCSRARLHLH